MEGRAYEVKSASDKVVFDTRTILRSTSSYKHHGMLLYIMTCSLHQRVATYAFHSRVSIPSPGIYAVMTFPLLNRTLATFLSPELGFLGFVTPTRKQTPFISGHFLVASCGEVGFRAFCPCRQPRRT
jgi:hypothetical protein